MELYLSETAAQDKVESFFVGEDDVKIFVIERRPVNKAFYQAVFAVIISPERDVATLYRTLSSSRDRDIEVMGSKLLMVEEKKMMLEHIFVGINISTNGE